MTKTINTKSPAWTAAIIAFLFGTAVHLFGLVNILHNYDDIAQQPKGYGTGISSGRWLLSLMGDFFEMIGGNYNLPLVNGLIFLVLIAVSAGFLVSTFQIRSKLMAALLGMIFVTFPSAFSTLAFRYTAIYYGIAILLSVLAVWVLHKHKLGLLLSALCTACSLGIYQAYVPITIGMFVLILLSQTLEPNADFLQLLRSSIHDCAALLLGLLFYYVFLKITLALYGTALSDYQGINEMGQLALADLPGLIKEAAYSVYMLPIKDYCGISASPIIKGIYLAICVFSCTLLIWILIKYVKKLSLILFSILLCLLFPVAVNFIVIMCPDSWVYTLMVYSFVLIPCTPVLLLSRFLALKGTGQVRLHFLSKGLAVALAILISCYAYQTNVNYTALYYANRQVENYLNSMIVQVRMTEGFDTEKKWAFIGNIEDPLLSSYWQYEMTYGGIEFTPWILQRYSWSEWVRNYYGYSLPMSSDTEIQALSEHSDVVQMPCWPNEGSIKIIDDTIVIKCLELQ